jgi:phage shock protein A
MPGLTGRMSTVVKAKISKMLDKTEDPAETLDYSYQKQLEQLQNVKKGIADVVTAKKRIQAQESGLQQQIVKLDTQARQALAAGRDDLARTALERKNVIQSELQSLDTQVTELEAQQESLTTSEQNLRTKIEQFRTKKEVIKAQYSAAEAQVRISEAATGVGDSMADVGLAMQRATDKTEQMKARASAVQELEAAGTFDDLTTLGSGEDDIDRQLRELSSTSAVDDEMAKLRAEVGPGSEPAGELGAGSAEQSAAPAATAEPAAAPEPAAVPEADTTPQFDEHAAEPEAQPDTQTGA